MTNNKNEKTEQELEAELKWEESTKHRDKHQDSVKYKAVVGLVRTLNGTIRALNTAISPVRWMLNKEGDAINQLDEYKTADELAHTGGSSFALGVVDDLIKGIRRVAVPTIQSGGILTSWAAAGISAALAPAEFAIDHLKDLLTSTAISGLAAEVGDLKEGQARLNAKVDAQGKLMTKRMGDMKAELEGDIKAQGEKFDEEVKRLDKEIAQCSGEIKKEKEERKAEVKRVRQEMQTMAQELTENLNRVEQNLTNALNDFRNEVNERFEEQEQKILANKRKIEEERIKREEEIREVKDNIKLATTNLENLRKEKEQIEDDFITYKSQVNQQTAETQQAFEDTQAEYERRTKIIETQIEDNQETIEEFNEQLTNVRNEQAQQNVLNHEIFENLQETNDLLFAQQRKLHLVTQQMDDIQEEVHERMDKLSQKLDERTNETLSLAQDVIDKTEKLTKQVQNIQKDTEALQEQVQKNKEETEKAKKEAKLANERLDNLLKSQSLMDFSSEQSNLDKIQKSLELKAEETKLLATLNLLQETKKLIQVELSEINWQVGIKKGTEREIPRPEGMLLNPNSSWAKQYTPEQLREWGWDTRLLGEHEQAPLTEDKRKEKQAPKNEQESKAGGEENSLAQDTIEKVENLKSETLERLSAIQQEIRTGLEEIESSPAPTKPTKPSQTTVQQVLQASQKVKVKQKALERQKEDEKQAKQKAAQVKEEEKAAQKKAQSQPTKENQQAVKEKEQETKQAQKEVEREKKETEKAEQALSQAQEELSSLELLFLLISVYFPYFLFYLGLSLMNAIL